MRFHSSVVSSRLCQIRGRRCFRRQESFVINNLEKIFSDPRDSFETVFRRYLRGVLGNAISSKLQAMSSVNRSPARNLLLAAVQPGP